MSISLLPPPYNPTPPPPLLISYTPQPKQPKPKPEMKNPRSIPSTTLLLLPALLLLPTALPTAEPGGILGREKATKFNVFWHDILNGRNPTAVSVVPPANNATARGNAFGMIRMIDNVMTETSNMSSKEMGRAQGFYAMTSMEGEVAALMVMNLVFSQGKYNGSTLTVTGWNPVTRSSREMPVVGGSGYFRFARGFVKLKTWMFDMDSQNAVVEYKVYVLHY